jgi:vacuolar-type H+-ATPase subunit I/STV1
MRGKTLIDWLNLSANIYLISRDEKLRETMSQVYSKLKDKVEEYAKTVNADGLENLKERLKEAGEFTEDQIESLLKKIYEKVHLVHEERMKKLEDQMSEIKREMALTEAKLVAMQRNNRKH